MVFGLNYKQLGKWLRHATFKRAPAKCITKELSSHSSMHSTGVIDAADATQATQGLIPSPPAWPPALYKHQQKGVDWLLKRERYKKFPGGLLCDEPGMGKTIQMGACMSLHPVKNTLLILPNAVIQQWYDTLTQMLPAAVIYIHHGSNKITDVSILDKSPMNIIIVTIAGIENPALNTKKKKKKKSKRTIKRTFGMKVFEEIIWDRIIMDECHYIKNKS